MFICVKYGDNETLICNPMCAVINLLNSIKRRAGYGNSNVTVDLSDETGLVKELDMHKHEYANKFLTSHGTYILVQKEMMSDSISIDSGSTPLPSQYQYTPLLQELEEHFPNYKLHVENLQPKVTRKRTGTKSPSPAGRYSSKSKKTEGTSKRGTAKKRQ
ncbi:uncharacterized protein CXorf65 homolog [Argopecten irradians]|uniref:uncharacterized protein CXorf65 homolog n=1 Tax=Argopecten irradians TaxID=31199 RepID=UPI0037173356